jgi:leucyl aminopeptidase
MKTSTLFAIYAATLATALAHPKDAQAILQDPQLPLEDAEQYLIELSPGERRYVTEDDKWKLLRVCLRHFLT